MADAAASTTNPIIEAMKNGETLGDIQSIVEKNPAALRQRDKDGYLPLHYALDRIGTVKADVALYLLKSWPGAAGEKTSDNDNEFLPAHLACLRAGAMATGGKDESGAVKTVMKVVEAHPQALLVRDAKGRLPLHVAFLDGPPPRGLVQQLVAQCPQARLEKDRDGCIPLRCAVRCDQDSRTLMQAVQHLVKQVPASVLVRSNDDESPVGLAVRVDAPINVLRLLVQQCPQQAVQERSVDGMTPLHAAAWKEEVKFEFTDYILSLWPDAVRQRSGDGRLPLHIAARRGSIDLSRRFHQLWPESIKVTTDEGWVPLHEAVCDDYGLGWIHHRDVVHYLVMHWEGSLRARTKAGWLPIHLEVQNRPWKSNGVAVPRLLVNQYPGSVRAATVEGFLPLHIAAGRGKFAQDTDSYGQLQVAKCLEQRLVQLLADQDRKTVRVQSKEGLYPLQYAVASGHSVPAVKILLDHWPESVELRTNDGSSLLHLAVAREIPSLELVKCLVDRRPEMLTECDSSGSLPLHCAVAQTNASVQVVKFLVKHSPMSVGQANGRGMLPLHIAALSGAPLDVVYLLAKFPRVVRDESQPGDRPTQRARLN